MPIVTIVITKTTIEIMIRIRDLVCFMKQAARWPLRGFQTNTPDRVIRHLLMYIK